VQGIPISRGFPDKVDSPRRDSSLPAKRIKLEVSSQGGPDYAATNGVHREQNGVALIHLKKMFYRLVESGDLSNKCG